ncbi:[citrate (pro-3S)-lyase] ligase [Clostridium thailandense]|nr:[citrate (pro-3S)-lyase] ligase [Clostridium thailandense]
MKEVMIMECFCLEKVIIENNDYKKLKEIKAFLEKQGLRLDSNVEYTVTLYEEDKIIATGSFEDRILKCIAVDDNYKGIGLSNEIVSELVNEEYRRGNNHFFIYTKPKNYRLFEDLGFYKVGEVPGKVILLENTPYGIKGFVENIKKKKVEGKTVSAVVVNCNPFTLGHKYLIEKASKESDVVHVFVVWEDKSVFPSEVRYRLVEEGLQHLDNIVLHKGEDYIISNATFPSYFIKKQDEVVKIHSLLDIELFAKYIVPALGINRRYVGEEPLCPVTNVYNSTMKEILPKHRVEVIEVPRMAIGSDVTSASRVRKLIKEHKLTEVKSLVPDTTYNFLCSKEAVPILSRI